MDSYHGRPIPEQVRGRAEDFVGRQWVLSEVVEWSEHQTGRYLLILGEPGIGKTALAAWLAGAGPAPGGPAAQRLDALRQSWAAVHFCIARGQRGTVNAGGFARSLAEQLAQRYDSFATAAIERIAPEVNISLVARENWGTMIGAEIGRLVIADRDAEDVYNRVVREPLQHLASVEAGLTVRILVDALDEGHTGQEPNIVTLIAGSGDLPPGVRFVMTSRNDPRVIDQFDDVRKLDFSSSRYVAAAEADLQSYIQMRFSADDHLRVLPRAEADNFQTRLARNAEGNFLYAKWVLDELAEGTRAIADVTSLPAGLYSLYRTFLDRITTRSGRQFPEAWLEKHEPFFGCLTVAAPAAPRACLPNWLGWTKAQLNIEVEEIRQLIEHVHDLPVGDDGYRLYHRSIAEFLSSDQYAENGEHRSNRYYVEPTRQHRRIASYYLSTVQEVWSGDWTKSDSYGLLQLPAHLLGAGDEHAFLALLKPPFLAAKLQRFESYRPVMADLLTGTRVAERSGDLAALLRLGISYVGLKEYIGNLQAGIAARLIGLYAEAGHADRAVDLARMIDTDWMRGVVLREIVGRLAATDQREALRIAEQINDDPIARAEALEKILAAAARGTPSQDDLVHTAAPLLAVVNQIVPRDDWERYWHSGIRDRTARTLRHADPERAGELLEQAVGEARTIERDLWRYESLRALASAYADAGKPEALHLYDESLTALAMLKDKRYVGPQAAATVREMAALDLEHAICVASNLRGVVERSFALAEIAHLVAQTTTGPAGSVIDEAAAAAGLAPSLIEEATAAADGIHMLAKAEAPEWEGQARAQLAWAMAAQDFEAAVAAAGHQRPWPDPKGLDPWDSAFALIAADRSHPVSDRLALARRIGDPGRRSTVLAALAREQMTRQTGNAANIIAEIPDPAVCFQVLAEAAALLAKRHDPQAAAVIHQAEQLARRDEDSASVRLAQLGAALADYDAPQAARLFEGALAAAAGGEPSERLEAYAVVAERLIRKGDCVPAVSIIRLALKSAYDIRSQEWVMQARAQLLGELARQDRDQALALARQLPDPARLVAVRRVLAAIADTEPDEAERLFAEFFGKADPSGWDWMVEDLAANALAVLVLAAARRSSDRTVGLAERLWRYPDEMSMLDLRCDTLAKASGLLAASDIPGAQRLLRTITPQLYGDPSEVGRALSLIARRDPARAERLSRKVTASYIKKRSGDPDQDICEMCTELADVMPDLALELSDLGRQVSRNTAGFAGYHSKVLSHAAAAIASEDRPRAETLIQQAVKNAKRSPYDWLKEEALLSAAKALATWDGQRGDRLLRDTVDLARARQAKVPAAAQSITRAAAITRDQDHARTLAEEAISVLERAPDADLLEEILTALSEIPETSATALAPKVFNAVLNGAGMMLKRLPIIIPPLVQAGKSKAIPASAFLEEFDTAINMIEELFIG